MFDSLLGLLRAAPVPRNPNRYLGPDMLMWNDAKRLGINHFSHSNLRISILKNHELEIVPFNIAKLRINLETSSFI